jgi:hypothetical protein
LSGGQSVTGAVTFTPPNAGSDSGSVSISFNTQGSGGGGKHHSFASTSSTFNLPVSGMGVATGQLSANPANLSFGSVQVGASQTLSETLSNSGGSSLTISAAQITGSGFSMSGLSLPVSLASGQSVSFSVTFSPTSS